MAFETQAGKLRVDVSRYELTVDGRRVKLERQPMDLLIFFVRRRGELVTREEIIDKLWGKDVFVDVDRSINSAVRKIRTALGDDPAQPHCLETVVGKGYRFIGNVEVNGAPPQPPADVATSGASPLPPAGRPAGRSRPLMLVGAALVVVIATVFWSGMRWRARANFPAGETHCIAVLPLANLSGDPSQDYFADGMTEELTTDLGKISSLKVISRTSAETYRNSKKSAPQIAQELNVEAIVEGSVLRSGNRVRITTQLIDAMHDKHIWAESYERDLGDVLAVQSTVALDIARQVRIRLTSAEQQRLSQHALVNPEAYDAYLRGRYSQTTQLPEALKDGLPAFQRAIQLDPTYATAYAGLADTYSLLANYNVLPPSQAFPQAEAAARKSVELDPASSEAHAAMAYPEHHYAWDWEAAEREYRTAITLSPSNASAHLRYAEYLSTVSRHDEAIAETHRALELDPLSLVFSSNLGRFLYHARRYDEAIDVLIKTLALDPGRKYAHVHLAMLYDEKGMYQEAMDQYRLAFGDQPSFGLAHLYARSGNPAKARQMLNQLQREAGDSDWFWLAGVYAALGDKNQAFACLDKAYAKHDFFLVFMKVHAWMDPLRSDPRYTALVQQMRFPSDNK
jgi:TolB-like protein/DNA-binding winged helix-turn-helix (wHTH) protein/Tfp pilus assembly protein PilF